MLAATAALIGSAMLALTSDIASRSGSSEPCCWRTSAWLSRRLRIADRFCFLGTRRLLGSLPGCLCIILASAVVLPRALADRSVLLGRGGRDRPGAADVGDHLDVGPPPDVDVDARP